MNIKHPLKYHLSAYFKPFLVYLVVFFGLLFGLALGFKDYENIYRHLTIVIVLVTILYIAINAFYEFTSLIYHYYNVRLIKYEFIVASFVYNLVLSLINTLLIFLYYLIVNKLFYSDIATIFPFDNYLVYGFIMLLNFTTFSLVGLVSLFLSKIKYLRFIIYSIIILLIGFISQNVALKIVDFILHIFNDNRILLILTPVLIGINLLVWFSIHWKSNRLN